jgi:hypothetical protein
MEESCEARAGEPAGRLAVVKLAILLPGRLFDSGDGSNGLTIPRGGDDIKSDVVATLDFILSRYGTMADLWS